MRRSAIINSIVVAAFALGFLFGASVTKLSVRGPRKHRTEQSSPALAFVREVRGPVERMSRDADGWEAIEGGEVYAAGDQIRSGDAGGAVIVLRTAGHMILGEDSTVELLDPVLDESGQQPAVLRVALLSGFMRVEAAGDADTIIHIDAGSRTVELDLGGIVHVAGGREAGQHLFSFLESEAFVLDGRGNSTTVPDTHGIVINGNDVSRAIPLPAPPRPIDKEESMRLYAGDEGGATPDFEFGEDAIYRVVVASDAELTGVVADVIGRGSDIRLTRDLPIGDYYWSAARITPERLTGQWTRTRRISVVEGEEPPEIDEVPSGRIVLRPGSTSTIFYTQSPPEIGLDWDGLTREPGYRLQLATDAAFRHVVSDSTIPESRFTARGLSSGSYWWKAKSPAGPNHSGRFFLRRTSGSVKPDRSVSKISDEYDKAKVIFQRQVPALEFQWKADRRVSQYRVKVSRTKSFAKVVSEQTVGTSPARLPAGTLRQGTYYWRVERLLNDGRVLYPGKVHELKVLFDNSVPALEITSPADRARISGNSVRVAGLARPGTKLRVNGSPVNIDRQGRFSATLSIDPADPRLVFETGLGSSRNYYVREIRHSSSVQN